MQVDHGVSKNYWFVVNSIDPEKVNDFSNLMPSCKVCNHYKRSQCIDGTGTHVGFRDYMRKFHVRFSRLPKNTTRPQTIKTKEYMQRIADRYGITADKPFSGVFYFETLNQKQ